MTMKHNPNKDEEFELQTKRQVWNISDWPTDVASIDYYQNNKTTSTIADDKVCPHTILLFIPGNPGCIEWYLGMLHKIVQNLGVGHAARAVSYAGHGVGAQMVSARSQADKHTEKVKPYQISKSKRKANVAYTIDGQVEHKIEWFDMIVSEIMNLKRNTSDLNNEMKFVFLSHSIGAHLVQRMLILRRDILYQTNQIIHLTPFHRFDPEFKWQHIFLSSVANAPHHAIRILQAFSFIAGYIPSKLIDLYLEKVGLMSQPNDRKLARELYSQPLYARNFLKLGTEEIREIPEVHDINGMRIIGNQCTTSILYCPGDHWAPLFHMHDIIQCKNDNMLPSNINVNVNKNLVHGFIVFPEMILEVVYFVLNSIRSYNGELNEIQSKL